MTRVNRIAINNQKLVCIPSQFGLVKFGWELMLSYPVEFTNLFFKVSSLKNSFYPHVVLRGVLQACGKARVFKQVQLRTCTQS